MKSITIDQVVYINNKVLISRLEYRLSTILIPMVRAHQLFSPMTKTAKKAMNIASSAHTNIITHTGITGLITLRQNQLIHHFTEFMVRINEQSAATTSSLIRLRKFQLDNRIVTPIWNLPHDSFESLSTKGNLTASILKCMKHMDFDIIPTFSSDDWSINGFGMDLVSYINFYALEDIIAKALASLRRSTMPIFWFNQCVNKNSTSLAPWKVIKEHYCMSAKGRTATWYTAIKDSIHAYDPPQDTSPNTMAITTPYNIVSTDRRKREWIYTDRISENITVGKIVFKNRTATYLSVEHWSCCDIALDLFSPCPGCTINRNVHEFSSCSFSIHRSWSHIIPLSFITIRNRNNGIRMVHIDDMATFTRGQFLYQGSPTTFYHPSFYQY